MRMPTFALAGWLGCLLAGGRLGAQPVTVFETTSVYHHIRVVDQGGTRFLSFDGSQETRMSILNPLHGHFEYTEFFHLPFLWNGRLTNVLMIGLGGASTQRAYAHYHSNVVVDTVELDPAVLKVAKEYFHFQESPTQRVFVLDGRVFLRRRETRYGAIVLDAYVRNRYGSAIPPHLVTKEFFELAAQRLATNGVLAYNVISSLQGRGADLLGAVYKTMKAVFPQVYLFPARESRNIVLIATMSPQPVTPTLLHQRATALIQAGRIKVPGFRDRVYAFRAEPPPNYQQCPLLTDDHAPVEGLLNVPEPEEPPRRY